MENAYLLANICITGTQKLLDLIGQVSRHFFGCNICERAESKTDSIHIRVIHVAVRPQYKVEPKRWIYALLQRVRHQHEHLLVLVQQQHDTQITQPFVTEAWAGYELETFHLAEVRLRTEHVDVEEFGNIVMSCIGVFLAEGSTYGRGLLLDQGAFVCDGLLG